MCNISEQECATFDSDSLLNYTAVVQTSRGYEKRLGRYEGELR